MKFIHLMRREKFTESVVRFYNQYFNNGEHEILFVNFSGNSSLIMPEVNIKQNEIFIEDNFEGKVKLLLYLRKLECNYLILHSLFLFNGFDIILLFAMPKLMKKLVWIEWGGDLYSWKDKQKNVKYYIKNKINYILRNKLKYIIFIFPPDIDWYKKEFPKSNAKLYYAPYTGYPPVKEYDHYEQTCQLKECVSSGTPIYIQVGHNGMETLNHIAVLNELKKFSTQNIRIFLPLSYGGTKEYIEKVSNFAEENFPGKTIILKEYISQEEYFELTHKVAIAIFYTNRQCALGNIHRLNFRNVKLFLDERGVMYEYFLNQGVPVEKFEDIRYMSYEDFITPPQISDRLRFHNYVEELHQINHKVQRWMDIYADLKNEI